MLCIVEYAIFFTLHYQVDRHILHILHKTQLTIIAEQIVLFLFQSTNFPLLKQRMLNKKRTTLHSKEKGLRFYLRKWLESTIYLDSFLSLLLLWS